MDITTIAEAGLASAFQHFDASAQRTAGFGADSDVDLASEAVEQMQAKQSVAANIAVLKTADQMIGQLLDLKT